jgi:hypothetical protein
MVNKTSGDPREILRERHGAADFDRRAADSLEPEGAGA